MAIKRIEWLDLIRTIAIWSVVLCHATELIYTMNLDYISTISIQSEVFLFFVFTVSRLGVPFFLMITGYLLLDRTYDGEKIRRFWKKNWLHLFVCTEIWFIIYEIFLIKVEHENISVLRVVSDLLFLHKVDMKHVWYMPVILGIYILIPFVANVLQNVRIKLLMFPLCFYFIFISGCPLLNVISNIYLDQPIELQLSLGFSGGMYGFYIILGYLLKRGMLKKIKSVYLCITAILCVVLGMGIQMWAYAKNYSYNIWYDSPFLYIASISLFELFSRVRTVKCYFWVNGLAKYSFAVYLIHMMVMMLLVRKMYILQTMQPVKVLILWLGSAILSYICVWCISKIPKLGKYILYIK